MTQDALETHLDAVLPALPEGLAGDRSVSRGRFRDVVEGRDRVLLVAGDRLEAFGQVLSSVPFKGEVLTRTAAHAFQACADIVPSHLVAGPGEASMAGTGRAFLAARTESLPVDVVVRGYLTGSAWRDYQAGRSLPGFHLPEGLHHNEKFPVPLVTAVTRGEEARETTLSRADVLGGGKVSPGLWAEVERVAMALFRRGQDLAAASGLILADARYEFGLAGGALRLRGYPHSPETARYWWNQSYAPLFALGEAQKELDTEPHLRWLAERGYSGLGPAPGLPHPVRAETALRWLQAYEALTGEVFEPLAASPQAETVALGRILTGALT